jgi:hypothetical protein
MYENILIYLKQIVELKHEVFEKSRYKTPLYEHTCLFLLMRHRNLFKNKKLKKFYFSLFYYLCTENGLDNTYNNKLLKKAKKVIKEIPRVDIYILKKARKIFYIIKTMIEKNQPIYDNKKMLISELKNKTCTQEKSLKYQNPCQKTIKNLSSQNLIKDNKTTMKTISENINKDKSMQLPQNQFNYDLFQFIYNQEKSKNREQKKEESRLNRPSFVIKRTSYKKTKMKWKKEKRKEKNKKEIKCNMMIYTFLNKHNNEFIERITTNNPYKYINKKKKERTKVITEILKLNTLSCDLPLNGDKTSNESEAKNHKSSNYVSDDEEDMDIINNRRSYYQEEEQESYFEDHRW